MYSGQGYYCNNINNSPCVFEVSKENRVITQIKSRIDNLEEKIESDIVVKSTTASSQTLNINARKGAYIARIASVNTAYGSFDFIGVSGSSLANDLLGNDANEKKTIPNRVFSAGVTFEKRLFLNENCNSITLTNPNGTIFTISLTRLPDSEEYDIVVASDGSGHLTDLYDAIKWVGDTRISHKTIFVKPGVYDMPELNFNSNVYRDYRNLSIIGADKNSVIVRNTNGAYIPAQYDNTPIQMSGNVTLKNLTIMSTSEDFDKTGTPAAYCIHIDFRAHEGDVFEVDNCNFFNDHNSSLALCPNKGQSIIVKDSYAKTTGISSREGTWQGVLISHDNNNGDGSGIGKIEIRSTILESDGNAMAITSNYFRIEYTSINSAYFFGSGKILKSFNGDVIVGTKTTLNNVTF